MSETTTKQEDTAAVQVAKINARQVIIVAVVTAVSGLVGAFIQGSFSSNKIKGLQQELEGPSASVVERKALYPLTADQIEDDLRMTANKRSVVTDDELSDEELQFKRLKRSVFFNMVILRANSIILEGTLDELKKRGYHWVDDSKARLIAEFPKIKTLRLRWLEDKAIPAFQEAFAEIARDPSIQSMASAEVVLPT